VRLRRRRPRRHPRPQRAPRLSARNFAILAFVVWGALLALFDWGVGRFRHPRAAEPVTVANLPPAAAPAEAPAVPAAAVPARTRTVTGPAAASLRELRSLGLPGTGLEALIVPVRGVPRERLRDQFDEPRGGGRRHEAIDILAPRNTPVIAAADGIVDKFFQSKAGGITIYERDPTGAYELYYAHLEAYAPGLQEGDVVRQGQIIGYVGTSGNAPKDVPHLHFAIFRMGPDRRWWEGEAINPYPLLAAK
jgi:murein DD-endopeptidase MepM/ murein hydrolase activator NlpD